ncbi:MAG: hypothetical protein IJP53_07655, partial [Synergistaceae bacterium]|nr:hypothetical protein [Synergistaceae bacterium]
TITRTLVRMKSSERWHERLSELRKLVTTEGGLTIEVFHQDIFDLFYDYYEEEYLRRFAEPRHGQIGLDMSELRTFWEHLHAMEAIQKCEFVTPPPRKIFCAIIHSLQRFRDLILSTTFSTTKILKFFRFRKFSRRKNF